MFGGRYTWFPWMYKGGLRRLPLMVRLLPGRPGRVVVKKPFTPKRSPVVGAECLTKPVRWSQGLPHQEPPPFGTHTVFIERRVHVPPATKVGMEIFEFIPGLWSDPTAYQVPFGWKFEVKKLKIVLLDTSYDTLYASILKNGHEALHVEGPQRLGSIPGKPPLFKGAGWMLLPCWPQDQFNTELRYTFDEWVGLQLVNDSFAEREVYVALWGWKYMDDCEREFTRKQ